MDTLFFTLVAFSVLTGTLAILALIEWVALKVISSRYWREAPHGQLTYDIVGIMGVIVPGTFTGLILFCVHTTLGWLGVVAACVLFALNIGIMYWLEHNEPAPKPMATRQDTLAS